MRPLCVIHWVFFGGSVSIAASVVPFIFSQVHDGRIKPSCFFDGFGLVGTYLLASVCKFVSDSYAKKSEENENLALQRKNELAFLLDNLPQGVLLIGSKGTVLPNYSTHTTEVLKEPQIAGKNIAGKTLYGTLTIRAYTEKRLHHHSFRGRWPWPCHR